MAKRKKRRTTTRKKKEDSAFVASLRRHKDPANFTLHVVSAPVLAIGLWMHNWVLLAIGAFYLFCGSLYALLGPKTAEEVWITLYKSNVNKWFSWLGLVLIGIGLWNQNITVILVGVACILFGLLYAAIVRDF
ncbi:hypothetical protein GF342_03305 [Candidatus Woesearchaeota archaeon]|nr:hypothetical protein [Candidatus Woesearchaeota archaeon]